MRHPSYFGFSWFALGAQLLLVNPICLVAYVFALRAFFHTRIQYPLIRASSLCCSHLIARRVTLSFYFP